MEHMLAVRGAVWCYDLLILSKGCIIIIGYGTAGIAVFIQVPKLNAQDGGLYSIKAAIAAYYLMVIALLLTVVGYHAQLVGERIIVGKHSTAITIAAEVLGWKERSTANLAHRSRLHSAAIREC